MQTVNRNGKHSVVQNLLVVLGGTALILLIPLMGMYFTDDFTWGLFDFVAGGVLLAGTGSAYVLASSRLHHPRHRTIIGIVLVLALLTIWAELAVGIFH